MEKSSIYIGEIIREVMVQQAVTKAELARRLNVRPQTVDYMLTRKSIDTDTLYQVSQALNYDFAMLYSIHTNQTNSDKPDLAGIKSARILVELELRPDDLKRLNLKKRIDELMK